jgi:hypothetical protein
MGCFCNRVIGRFNLAYALVDVRLDDGSGAYRLGCDVQF